MSHPKAGQRPIRIGPRTSESARIFQCLLRGEATSAEYVAALRREAKACVKALRGGGS